MMGTKRKLPFGYKMESGRIAVDTAESHWVTHLFSRYNMGVSIQELANFMNDTAVRYDLNKPWNKNMADTRYLGESGFPVLVDASVFLNTEEKRKKKAPAVQKTEAQTVLRRKCGFRITPHIGHEVLYLLNCLANNPERIVTPQMPRAQSQRLDTLKSELEGLIGQLPVDENRTREVLQEIAAEMYADIDPREYETQRLRRLFQKEVPGSELDANLIAMSISAVLMDGNGNVKIRLKNDQIVEMGEQNG
mgnify:CR=1 FL=1